LQYRLWMADGGMREVWRLRKEVATQAEENTRLKERNRNLSAEVLDLKKGKAAIEERARADLGMVGANETFFQVAPVDSHNAQSSSANSSSASSMPAIISTPSRRAPVQVNAQQ
ncbi:MAG: cell division protein FtsB, partial [Steroidobacter sp.]